MHPVFRDGANLGYIKLAKLSNSQNLLYAVMLLMGQFFVKSHITINIHVILQGFAQSPAERAREGKRAISCRMPRYNFCSVFVFVVIFLISWQSYSS